jgi:ribulose-5-phosphate 4-epimerase/fuculose-1-phosphate aldolase
MATALAHDQTTLAPLRQLPPKALPTVMGPIGQPRPPQPTLELERLYRKQRLAAAFRIFGHFGWDLGGAGHITVRDPEYPDHFWLNPAGVHFSHIRVSDLMLVNHHSDIVEHGEVKALNRAAFAIHSRLHLARPDVDAAAHSHSIYGKAFSILGKLLDPLTQDSCGFYEDHAVFENFSGVVLDTDEGDRIGQILGHRAAVILQNHGILTVGSSVETAVWRYIALENCCQTQLLADAAGPTKKIPHEVARHTHDQVGGRYADGAFQPYFDFIARREPDLFD